MSPLKSSAWAFALLLLVGNSGRAQSPQVRDIPLPAEKLAGGASHDELEGQAIVEASRARGTAKLKPKSFFEKGYSAEISFDASVLPLPAASQ